MTNRNKNNFFLTCFDPVAAICVTERDKEYTFMTTFFENSLSVSFHFSGLVSIDKLHYFDQRICFPNNGCLGNRKRLFFSYHSKNFMKNLNLIDSIQLKKLS